SETETAVIQAAMNGIEDALSQCGVTETTLTRGEKEALDQHGYLVLPAVVDATWLDRLRAAFETAIGQGQQTASAKQSGTRACGRFGQQGYSLRRRLHAPESARGCVPRVALLLQGIPVEWP